MTDSHDVKLVKTDSRPIVKQTVHPLVEMAQRGGAVDTAMMRELMELQREWEASEAKKAFTEAMVAMKAALPAVINKNKKVSFGQGRTSYSFATIAHAMKAIQPHLADFGFELSWTPDTTDKVVSVECVLTHVGGHSKRAKLSAPPDTSGSKNPVQAIGATMTYLERYTALSLLGIVTQDMEDADAPIDNSKVDAGRNLKALGVLSSEGISKEEAEEYLQSDIKYWTTKDLERLKDLIRDRRAVPIENEQPNDKGE